MGSDEESCAAADELADVEANNVILVLSPPANHRLGSSIGPLTPDSNRENIIIIIIINDGEQQDHEFTVVSSSETPKETLFDSFAPPGCPDKLMMLAPPSPHHRKYYYREESRVVRRPLNFNLLRGHESNMETISCTNEEEHLFEIVYGTILDAIVSEHKTKEVGVVSAGFELELDDGYLRTPKSSAPHLSVSAAETCPGAPIKSTSSKYRNIIDKEICKKLQF